MPTIKLKKNAIKRNIKTRNHRITGFYLYWGMARDIFNLYSKLNELFSPRLSAILPPVTAAAVILNRLTAVLPLFQYSAPCGTILMSCTFLSSLPSVKKAAYGSDHNSSNGSV